MTRADRLSMHLILFVTIALAVEHGLTLIAGGM